MQRDLFLKCLLLGGVGLVLAVPLLMIASTVAERTQFRDEALRNIAANTAGPQRLSGPVLVVPVTEEFDKNIVSEGRAVGTTRERRVRAITLAARDLHVAARLQAERRAYGIHSGAVYEVHAALTGTFDPPAHLELPDPGPNSRLTYGTPRLVVGVGDARGLASTPDVHLQGASLAVEGGTKGADMGPGFHADLPASALGARSLEFRVDLVLVGTGSFAVVPTAGVTSAEVLSNWPDPSFGGGFLPREQETGKEGFRARWSVSRLATDLDPAEGAGPSARPGAPSFEVRLIDPVDIYQEAMRAVKYGFLFIVVLFAGFFATEVLAHIAIHPIQYLLVGLALALFFLLLVALSEHLSFGRAYLVAALASLALIVAYLASALRSTAKSLQFGAALAILYGALYGVLLSEQNALLLGSLLLFVMLAILMIGTRRVDWYRIRLSSSGAVG